MSEEHNEHWGFPAEAQDAIEARLREQVSPRVPRIDRTAQHARPSVVTPTIMQMPEPPGIPHLSHPVRVTPAGVSPTSAVEGISIPLPSNFYWYDFKDLYVKPLRVPHLAKINLAHETGDQQPLAEVVSSLLSTPGGHKNIALDLCTQDWLAILYHLKFNSFNKRGLVQEWECSNEEHVKAHNFWASMNDEERAKHEREIASLSAEERDGLTKWFMAPPPGIRHKSEVTSTQIRTNYLTVAPDTEKYRVRLSEAVLSCRPYARMRPETLRDAIQFCELPNWEHDHELQFLAQIAAVLEVLRPDGSPYSLGERIEMIRSERLDLSTEDYNLIREFVSISESFGTEEFVSVRCMGCGASTMVQAIVDASTFLTKDV